MTIEFINSETVKLDGKEMIYLREPLVLLKQIKEMLYKVGPEKFFSSPDEEVKRSKESMAGLFLLLALQSKTTESFFLMQPKSDPPDFILMKLGNDIEKMTVDPFELVEIPARCASFEEMLKIVQKKLDKGYSESYHLLIFINNQNCKVWVQLLNNELKNYDPFRSVWTLHLLEHNGEWWPVVNRLRPYPILHIEAKLGDIKLPTGMPDFMEEKNHGGMRFIVFKPAVTEEFIKKIRKIRLGRKN